MPDVFRVQVRPGDQERLGYAAFMAGKAPLKFLEDLIHDFAQSYPLPPAPPRERRPMSEIRAQRRVELGGVSPYTAAIDIIPTRKDPA